MDGVVKIMSSFQGLDTERMPSILERKNEKNMTNKLIDKKSEANERYFEQINLIPI